MQWIPGSDDGTPQVIGDMWKDKMDLNYTKYNDRNGSFHNNLSLTFFAIIYFIKENQVLKSLYMEILAQNMIAQKISLSKT